MRGQGPARHRWLGSLAAWPSAVPSSLVLGQAHFACCSLRQGHSVQSCAGSRFAGAAASATRRLHLPSCTHPPAGCKGYETVWPHGMCTLKYQAQLTYGDPVTAYESGAGVQFATGHSVYSQEELQPYPALPTSAGGWGAPQKLPSRELLLRHSWAAAALGVGRACALLAASNRWRSWHLPRPSRAEPS